MDSGTLILLIWVGVVFASIVCTAAYFGGLGGAIIRCFSRVSTRNVRRSPAVTPVQTLQSSTIAATTVSPHVEKGETDNVSTTTT
ncbi:hypothetical protein DCAR_0522449 [Daucus carota subsp. sativus]|uniref:Uncharacterized protein n=1 Tax=Daucus carota subsp. sativus TaxID=79200 RepID=A0A164ZTP0_DAUCS|nr:hypothetical protein DCAR_0522449 [Daucus carota subsp. sativus]